MDGQAAEGDRGGLGRGTVTASGPWAYTLFLSPAVTLSFFLHVSVNMTRLTFRSKLYFKTIPYMENLCNMLVTVF